MDKRSKFSHLMNMQSFIVEQNSCRSCKGPTWSIVSWKPVKLRKNTWMLRVKIFQPNLFNAY